MSEKILKLRKGSQLVEADVGVKTYKDAAAAGKTLFQHINDVNADKVDPGMSASAQILMQAGFEEGALAGTPEERRKKLGAVNLGEALTGERSASITREGTAASRLLAPALILELVEDKRFNDKSSELQVFRSQVASTRTLAGSRYEQPLLNLDIPGTADYARSSQLALPNVMGSITLNSRSGTIPSFALGLEISDQAARAFSFDQVALILARQRDMHEIRALEHNMAALVNGDVDLGQAALPVVTASTFDASAVTPETFSQKALMKILRRDRLVRQPTHVWGDEEAYNFYIERLGRKTAANVFVEDPESGAKIAKPINLNVAEPEFWIVEDGVVPAGRLVFLDARYAIEEYINSEANYEATEQVVMRRATQMRFDYGKVMRRFDDNAWLVVDMTA